jgi:N-dimethylarginine dimethylaminohydrolase
MPKVLLCPPDYFDVVDQKNPCMSKESAVDRVKARIQWDALCSVLQKTDLAIFSTTGTSAATFSPLALWLPSIAPCSRTLCSRASG